MLFAIWSSTKRMCRPQPLSPTRHLLRKVRTGRPSSTRIHLFFGERNVLPENSITLWYIFPYAEPNADDMSCTPKRFALNRHRHRKEKFQRCTHAGWKQISSNSLKTGYGHIVAGSTGDPPKLLPL